MSGSGPSGGAGRRRAVLFDAGHTLLRMDYAAMAVQVRARGIEVTEAAVVEAERAARVRVDAERSAAATRERTAQGRYLGYLLDALGVAAAADRAAIAGWRRGYNLPVGLVHRADPEADAALRRVRAAGLRVGVVSNSNGSARLALERAGLAAHLEFVVDSHVVGVAKPDPRVFHLALAQAGAAPEEAVYVGATPTSPTCSARARRAWPPCCSTPAATGACATAPSPAASPRR